MTEVKPKPVAPYSIRDETDLLWYHGQGQTTFERSTMGGMLERASSLAIPHRWPTVPVFSGEHIIGRECGVTAWPTAELRQVSGNEPDAAALTQYARVSRLMMLVERADAQSAVIIALLFGDSGQRWAATEHGRKGAFYHLTVKGRALVEEAAKAPGALDLTAQARIENIAIADKAQPKPERTLALAVCARQAAKLEERAREVWHTVKST